MPPAETSTCYRPANLAKATVLGRSILKKKTTRTPWIQALMAGLLALLIASILVMASVPPVSRDALTHHLAVPKLYLKSGGIYEIPEILFSYYPMNLDLLYLIPLYFGMDIVPKYIHFIFGLLTAWLIYGFLRDRIGQRIWGLLGALLFLSLPMVVKLSITVYVDLGMVFFSTAALIYVLKWALVSHRLQHLCYAAVFCGLCLGTKYNGLITFFLLTCSIPILYLRGRLAPDTVVLGAENATLPDGNSKTAFSFHALGAAVLFAAISLAVFSPWMIRNYFWTGNPLYPLYQSAFESENPDLAESRNALRPIMSTEAKEQKPLSHFVIRKRVFNESLLETVSTPVRIFFQGRDNNPKYFDGRLNPYLFFFPFLAFVGFGRLSRRQRIETMALAVFAILFLLYTFFKVDMRIRWVMPIIPPLVILSVIGLHQGWTFAHEKWTGMKRKFIFAVLTTTVVFFLTLNGLYAYAQFRDVDPLSFISGKMDRDTYITKYRDEYPAFRYINLHLPADASVLSLYLGNRIYYSDRKMFCGDDFFNKAVIFADSAEQLKAILRSRGFTHLLVRYDFFERFLLSYLSKADRQMIEVFLKQHTAQLFDTGNYRVLVLLESPSTSTG